MVYINQQAAPVRLHSYARLALPQLMIMPPILPTSPAPMFSGPRPFAPRCFNAPFVGEPSFASAELKLPSQVEKPNSTKENDVGSRFRNSVRDRLGDELEADNEIQGKLTLWNFLVKSVALEVLRRWKMEVDKAEKTGDFIKTHQMTSLSDQVVRFACEYAATVREECRKNFELKHQNDSEEKSSETPISTNIIFNVDAIPFVPDAFSVKSTSNQPNNCDSTLTSPQVSSNSTLDPYNSEGLDGYLKEFQLEKPIFDFTEDVPNIVPFGRQSPGFNSSRRCRAHGQKEQQTSAETFDPVIARPRSTSLSTTQTSASSLAIEQETYIPWSEGLDEERIRYAQNYFK
ncbi:hypothetical protein M3Y98_00656800 [Aphelenchoides besseyi]|nr:hypothetical protein M3Y98_00656800 [Aphelenchoides besseyi]KAI6208746.1 hypothetical protein M3Y96_00147500 [Aphelenchoides besseyi]